MEPVLITLVVVLGVSLLAAIDLIARQSIEINKLEAKRGSEVREEKMSRIRQRAEPGRLTRPVLPHYVPPAGPNTGEVRAILTEPDGPAYHCDGRRAYFDDEGRLIRPPTNRVTPRQRAARLVPM